jgi:drug/metabolite transporter (DMT)-like permease
MSWFFIALVAPLLWALTNFIDKALIQRFVSRDLGVWVLSLYSALFSFLVAPIVLIFNHNVLDIPVYYAIMLIAAGCVEVASIYLYLNALRKEDTSTVVPIFQTIPIFGLIFGFFILGEELTGNQILAIFGVMLGAILLTLEFSEDRRIRTRWIPLLLMLGASLCFALYDALFKYVALIESFWTAVFWQHVGVALLGIIFLSSKKKYRVNFIANIRQHGGKVLGLNALNEGLYTMGVMVYSFALLLAPIALVATTNAYQPLFVFIIGLFFTLFLPGVLSEKLSLRHIVQKLVAIFIVIVSSAHLLQ